MMDLEPTWTAKYNRDRRITSRVTRKLAAEKEGDEE